MGKSRRNLAKKVRKNQRRTKKGSGLFSRFLGRKGREASSFGVRIRPDARINQLKQKLLPSENISTYELDRDPDKQDELIQKKRNSRKLQLQYGQEEAAAEKKFKLCSENLKRAREAHQDLIIRIKNQEKRAQKELENLTSKKDKAYTVLVELEDKCQNLGNERIRAASKKSEMLDRWEARERHKLNLSPRTQLLEYPDEQLRFQEPADEIYGLHPEELGTGVQFRNPLLSGDRPRDQTPLQGTYEPPLLPGDRPRNPTPYEYGTYEHLYEPSLLPGTVRMVADPFPRRDTFGGKKSRKRKSRKSRKVNRHNKRKTKRGGGKVKKSFKKIIYKI